MSEKKWIRKERDLVKILENKGYSAVRVVGSGGGTERPLPDILTGNAKNIYGIELKSSSKNVIYIEKHQIQNLKKFCENFGAIPIICIKFNYIKYTFIKISNLTKTDKGNFKITKKALLNIIKNNHELML